MRHTSVGLDGVKCSILTTTAFVRVSQWSVGVRAFKHASGVHWCMKKVNLSYFTSDVMLMSSLSLTMFKWTEKDRKLLFYTSYILRWRYSHLLEIPTWSLIANRHHTDIDCIQWEHKVRVNTLIFPALIEDLLDLYLAQQMFRKPHLYAEARLVISLLMCAALHGKKHRK